MKTKRIKHLNELYKMPIRKPTKIKRNAIKTIFKRVLLHRFTVAMTVYLLIILSIIILTLKL